jgi:hypothetical protein
MRSALSSPAEAQTALKCMVPPGDADADRGEVWPDIVGAVTPNSRNGLITTFVFGLMPRGGAR